MAAHGRERECRRFTENGQRRDKLLAESASPTRTACRQVERPQCR